MSLCANNHKPNTYLTRSVFLTQLHLYGDQVQSF